MLRSIEFFILFLTLGSLSLVELQKCDPLAGYFLPESTLPCNKSRIEWHGDNEGLHLETSFADCERSGNESSVEKVTFSLAPNHPNIYTLYIADYYFEYSMQWLTNDTNCVIDLLNISTNNNIRDQNGLTNNPFEVNTLFWYYVNIYGDTISTGFDSLRCQQDLQTQLLSKRHRPSKFLVRIIIKQY